MSGKLDRGRICLKCKTRYTSDVAHCLIDGASLTPLSQHVTVRGRTIFHRSPRGSTVSWPFLAAAGGAGGSLAVLFVLSISLLEILLSPLDVDPRPTRPHHGIAARDDAAAAYLREGQVLADEGRLRAALELVDRGLAVDPHDPEIVIALVRLQDGIVRSKHLRGAKHALAIGEASMARDHLDRVVTVAPGDAEAKRMLAAIDPRGQSDDPSPLPAEPRIAEVDVTPPQSLDLPPEIPQEAPEPVASAAPADPSPLVPIGGLPQIASATHPRDLRSTLAEVETVAIATGVPPGIARAAIRGLQRTLSHGPDAQEGLEIRPAALAQAIVDGHAAGDSKQAIRDRLIAMGQQP